MSQKQKPAIDITTFSAEDMYRVLSRCMSFGDSAKFLGISKAAWSLRWKELKLKKPKVDTFCPADPNLPGYHEVAIVSDFHLGSLWQQKTALGKFCDLCISRGITSILCAGDLTDGLMNWPLHEKERFLHSEDAYLEYLEEYYPSGFSQNSFIVGNHDMSFGTFSGPSYDFGEELQNVRKDLTYHIQDEQKISKSFELPGNVSVNLYHGAGSCSNPMMKQKRDVRLHSKILEMLGDGADDVHFWIFGHCHRNCVTAFMGKIILGVPCFQNNTPYALSRGSKNDIGGTILKYNVDHGNVSKFSSEFIDVNKLGGIVNRDF